MDKDVLLPTVNKNFARECHQWCLLHCPTWEESQEVSCLSMKWTLIWWLPTNKWWWWVAVSGQAWIQLKWWLVVCNNPKWWAWWEQVVTCLSPLLNNNNNLKCSVKVNLNSWEEWINHQPEFQFNNLTKQEHCKRSQWMYIYKKCQWMLYKGIKRELNLSTRERLKKDLRFLSNCTMKRRCK